MAKKNVEKLLNRIVKESEKKYSKQLRRKFNKRIHYHEVIYRDLVEQLYHQVRGTYGKSGIKILDITKEQETIIAFICKKYFKALKVSLTTSSGAFTSTIEYSTPNSFKVRIESPNINDNFEGFIAANRKGPMESLVADLQSKLAPTFSEDISTRIERPYDIGHREGSSIVEQRAKDYLSSFAKSIQAFKTKELPPGVEYESTPMYRLEMAVTSNKRLDFVRQTISVKEIDTTEQGRGSNYQQSIEERKLMNSFKKDIVNSLMEEDWAYFSSSTSPMDRVRHSILKSAYSSKSLKNKKELGSVEFPNTKAGVTAIKGRVKATASKEKAEVINVPSTANTSPSSTKKVSGTKNWSSILPLLNAQLPPRVIANMKYPALVNRTGTLANSAEITAVEQTKEGFPTFVFNYERDPYDVFDRTLGRSPWNTPERDPRALVDKSVRDLVRQMAIGRFYTRRA